MAKNDWFQIKKNVGRKTAPAWIGGYISADGQAIIYIERTTNWGDPRQSRPRKEWNLMKYIPQRNATIVIPTVALLLTKQHARNAMMKYMEKNRH